MDGVVVVQVEAAETEAEAKVAEGRVGAVDVGTVVVTRAAGVYVPVGFTGRTRGPDLPPREEIVEETRGGISDVEAV